MAEDGEGDVTNGQMVATGTSSPAKNEPKVEISPNSKEVAQITIDAQVFHGNTPPPSPPGNRATAAVYQSPLTL